MYSSLNILEDVLGRPLRRPQQSTALQLSPEEEESLLRSLASDTLSGVGWAGSVLDKGGATLRGIASGLTGGEWGGGPMNLLPDSWTGLTEADKIDEWELAEQWGLSKHKEGLGWEDAIPVALGIGLDPLTYMTLGASALGKAGKFAKTAGYLDDAVRVASKKLGHTVGKRQARMVATLGDVLPTGIGPTHRAAAATKGLLDKPLGGLIGGGVPFFPKLQGAFGTGDLSKAAAGLMDAGADKLKYSAPVRGMRALVDPRVGGKVSKQAQQLAESLHTAMPGVKYGSKRAFQSARDTMDETYDAFDDLYGDALRPTGPGTAPSNLGYDVGDVVEAADRGNYGYVQGVTDEGAEVYFRNPKTGTEAVKNLKADLLSRKYAKGSKEAAEFAGMHDRGLFDRIARMTAETEGDVGRAFGEIAPELNLPGAELAGKIKSSAAGMQDANRQVYEELLAKGGRGELLEGVPDFAHFPRGTTATGVRTADTVREVATTFEGAMHRANEIRSLPAEIVNKVLKDESARGAKAAVHILSKYGRDLGTSDVYTDLVAKAGEVIGKVAQKKRLGSADKDLLKRFQQAEKLVGPNGDLAKGLHAVDLKAWIAKHPKSRYVDEGKNVFSASMLDDLQHYQLGVRRASAGVDAIHDLFAKSLADDGVDLATAFKSAGMDSGRAMNHLSGLTGQSVDDLASRFVPADAAQAAASAMKVQQYPEWAQKIGESIDTVTQWFRDNVTLPFPAFVMRNHGSGQVVNMTTGLMDTPADLAQYWSSYARAGALLKNPDKGLLDELEAVGLIGKYGFEDTSTFRAAGDSVQPGNLLNVQETYRSVRASVAEKPIAMDQIPGFRTARRAHGTLLGTGAKANHLAEWMNRVPLYLYLKDKGYKSLDAAQEVIKRHFDYGDLAPFEKQVMRRAIPFYTFTRKMAGLTAQTLAERPGGALSHIIQLTGSARGENTILPEHLASTAAIPFSQGKQGESQYLTGLGMAHENPLGFMGDGVRGFLMEAASMANPLFKGPAEWATGESFFQRGRTGGRDLTEMDPPLGRFLANLTGHKNPVKLGTGLEHFLSNLPTSRYVTTGKGLSDTRKTWVNKVLNFFTGARVTTIPPGVEDKMIGDALADMLVGSGVARTFSRPYIPKGSLDDLPPEERLEELKRMALYNLIGKRSGQRAKGEPIDQLGL